MKRMVLLAIVLLMSGCAARATPEPPGTENTVLRWKARSESGIYGYLVYRSDSETGPFIRLNREIIHVRPGDRDEPSEYHFTDHEVVPGRTYYYFLDTIGENGKKRRFSGVISKTVPGP